MLTFVESLPDNTSGVDGLEGSYSVLVSGDGANVYVGSISDHAVATFARDAPLVPPLVVQVQASDAACWTAAVATP